MHILDIVAIFVCLAGIFIYVNTYFIKLPSSIGLMLMALCLSFCILVAGWLFPDFIIGTERVMENYDYSDVLYQVVLIFMLFAGALQIDFKKLAQEKWPVLILATASIFISTVIVGLGIFYILKFSGIHLDLIYCLVFGALISPTDPIALTSTIKKYNLSKRLAIQVSGESLFNDGVAVVLALTLLDLAHTGEDHRISFWDVGFIFSLDVGGGIILGLILGFVGYRLLKYIDNDQSELEILVTLALVLTGAQIATVLHISAKQAAVVAGLIIGNEGRGNYITSVTSDYVFKFWSLMEESLNAMLFVLIGLEMLVITIRLDYFAAGFFAFTLILVARFISVGIPIKLMSVFKQHHFEKHSVTIMTWGGLRGGIPIALSLSLPEFEGKDIIVTMTYTVVVLSILFQGLTVRKLLEYSFGVRLEKPVNADHH
ncbi:MAG: sodium:proton antiporter [Imperialibacter sp.]|uniref:cation:proton antiporter n=1 Tax=Imperialibacter sp. TaxID=2038411 RepID=UPI0032EB56FE